MVSSTITPFWKCQLRPECWYLVHWLYLLWTFRRKNSVPDRIRNWTDHGNYETRRNSQRRWLVWSQTSSLLQSKHKNIQPSFPKFQKIMRTYKNLDRNGIELLESMISLNPKKRISIQDALKHSYFNWTDLNDEKNSIYIRNCSFKKVFRKLLLDSIVLYFSSAIHSLVLNKRTWFTC